MLIRTEGSSFRLGHTALQLDSEAQDPVLALWFSDLSAIPRMIKEPEFLRKVAERLDAAIEPSVLGNVLQAFVYSAEGGEVLELNDTGSGEEGFDSGIELKAEEYRVRGARSKFVQFLALGPEPQVAQQRAEALVNVFLEEGRRKLAGDVVTRRRILEQLEARLEARFKARTKRLATLPKASTDPTGVELRAKALRAAQIKLQGEIAELRHQTLSEVDVPPSRPAEGEGTDDFEQQVRERALELAVEQKVFRPESQQYQRLEGVVERLEQVQQRRLQVEQEAREADRMCRLEALERLLEEVHRELESLQAQSLTRAESSERDRLEHEVAGLRGELDRVRSQLFFVNLEEKRALEKGSLVLIEEPHRGLPFGAVATTRQGEKGFLPGLVMASLLATFLIVTLWEHLFLQRNFLTRVERFLELPVLAVVPVRPAEQTRLWDTWKANWND